LTHVVEALGGAVVLAVVAGFVAVHDFEGAGLVAEGAEGEGGLGGGGFGGDLFALLGLFAHFKAEAGLFHAPEPELTPAADGHVLDETALGFGLRPEFLNEGGEELEEAVGGFGFEDYGVGEDSVAEGVSGGVGFAFQGDRAFGFAAVSAGGI